MKCHKQHCNCSAIAIPLAGWLAAWLAGCLPTYLAEWLKAAYLPTTTTTSCELLSLPAAAATRGQSELKQQAAVQCGAARRPIRGAIEQLVEKIR